MSDFFQPAKASNQRTAGSLHPGSTALPFRLQLAAVELSSHQFP